MIKKCINPRNVNFGLIGKTKKLIFGSFNPDEPYYTLNCGVCLYCQQQYSKGWATRLMLESKLHNESCFVTLTYNDANLPYNNSLQKRDVQLFIKRLRKKLAPKKIRYFLTGEYGGRKGRAHYHLVIFGYVPKDLVFLKQTNKQEYIYTSKELSNVWKKGYISIGTNMTLNSLKYVAKYLAKMSNYDPITQNPPFSTQSNRPGIGAGMFDIDMYDTDGIYLDGRKWRIPRYFDKLAERMGYDLELIKAERDAKVKSYGNTFPTLKEKQKYKTWVESQGYDIKHLFTPSAKVIRSNFVPIDRDGVVNRKGYEMYMSDYYDFHFKHFLEIPDAPYVRPWDYKLKQMSFMDFDTELLRKIYFI